jgi:hypothetical protein
MDPESGDTETSDPKLIRAEELKQRGNESFRGTFIS